MVTSEFRDLHKLAQKRTREAAASVLQLLDDDEERTALLLACAIDFVDGASICIREDNEELTKDQALAAALGMLISSFGTDKVVAAFRHLKEARS